MTAQTKTLTTLKADLRETVAEAMLDQIETVNRKQHERNCHTLYVDRDGSLSWGEEADSAALWIDREASSFAAVPHLIQVGTGSIDCDCDWCQGPDSVDSTDDIDCTAEDSEHLAEQMARALAEIPQGYFADEAE